MYTGAYTFTDTEGDTVAETDTAADTAAFKATAADKCKEVNAQSF